MTYTSLNPQQWKWVYFAAAATLIVIFLHSPWTGYATSSFSSVTWKDYRFPFTDWHTEAPLVLWLGNVVNLIATLALIALLTGIALFANRDSPTPRGDA
jgi:predicted Co/Zn/Cd cation transporter (cation efflux family)